MLSYALLRPWTRQARLRTSCYATTALSFSLVRQWTRQVGLRRSCYDDKTRLPMRLWRTKGIAGRSGGAQSELSLAIRLRASGLIEHFENLGREPIHTSTATDRSYLR
jgi:hypothetical protein